EDEREDPHPRRGISRRQDRPNAKAKPPAPPRREPQRNPDGNGEDESQEKLEAGCYRRFCFAIEPFLSALNATPRVALLPLIIIWVGIGIWSKVLVVFLGAVIPICINSRAGVRTTDAKLLRVARSFKAAEGRLFRTIILP